MLFAVGRKTYKHIKIKIKAMTEVLKNPTVAVFHKQLHFSLVHMNDMAGEAETKQTLQNKIDNIENFCYISGMRLNVDKK